MPSEPRGGRTNPSGEDLPSGCWGRGWLCWPCPASPEAFPASFLPSGRISAQAMAPSHCLRCDHLLSHCSCAKSWTSLTQTLNRRLMTQLDFTTVGRLAVTGQCLTLVSVTSPDPALRAVSSPWPHLAIFSADPGCHPHTCPAICAVGSWLTSPPCIPDSVPGATERRNYSLLTAWSSLILILMVELVQHK